MGRCTVSPIENFLGTYMDVSKNRGILPPKWMVKIMENPFKMDDLGGFTIILENAHIELNIYINPQHTPWSICQASPKAPKRNPELLHKLLVGGLEYGL